MLFSVITLIKEIGIGFIQYISKMTYSFNEVRLLREIALSLSPIIQLVEHQLGEFEFVDSSSPSAHLVYLVEIKVSDGPVK